jgi:type IV pilus assembly protein PilN
LLPWRELRREQEKKRFTTYLAFTIALSVVMVFLVNYYVTAKVEEQTALNNRLEAEITEYKKQIVEIKELKTLRKGLIARMEIIQNLQATRILTVRLFDELITILPDGVYVNRMERVGDRITISGYTESNSNISRLMKNIELSQWIQLPQLTEIKKSKEGSEDSPSEFKLSFILKPKSTTG